MTTGASLVVLVGLVAGAAVAVPRMYRRAPRAACAAASMSSAVAFVITCVLARPSTTAPVPAVNLPWVEVFGVTAAWRLDGLTVVFALLITGVGTLVLSYAPAYLSWNRAAGRLLALLLAFEASMLWLVLADDAITLFIGWELTSVTSYALIAFDDTPEARAKARQALLVTSSGGLALLAGLVLASLAAGGQASVLISNLSSSELRTHASYPVIVCLVAAGAFTKSAQAPLHFWLPGAMVAPTPVSAYLHSATMVTAGVYLLMRLHPSLGGTALWAGLFTTVGAITLVVGAALAVLHRDLKLTLAYSTVAILGALTMLIGVGSPEAIVAAIALLVAHALYKSALFLVAGNVAHQTGTRDPFAAAASVRGMPWSAAAAMLAAASMAGAPVLFGSIAKDALFAAVIGASWAGVLVVVVVAAAICLVLSAWIAGVAPFVRSRRADVRDAPWWMLAAPVILASCGAVLGLGAWILQPVATAAASVVLGQPVDAAVGFGHEEHGLALALGLLSLAVGSIVFWLLLPRHERVAGVRRAAARIAGDRAFEAVLDAVMRGAKRMTSAVQHGRFHGYVVSVFATLVVVVGLALLLGDVGRPRTDLVLAVHELPIVAVAAAGALAATVLRDRLASVAALGATGLAVTFLFALFSAPDLAITQLTVETVMVIVLVLAFRRAPPHVAQRAPAPIRATRVVIACCAGALTTALLLLATAEPAVRADASAAYVELAPREHARNVVNAILVNFRAIDTLGETLVLAVSGLGVLALVGGQLGRGQAAAGSALLRLTTTRGLLVGLVSLLSVFVLLRGHDAPGGGFTGGLLLATALAVPLLARGADAARRVLRVDPRSLVGAGLLAIAGAAVAGLAAGASLLTPLWGPTVPSLVHLGTVLLFDVGVYLVVAGTALTIILALVKET